VINLEFDVSAWQPKTQLGRDVKANLITDIDQILKSGRPIQEAEIVSALLPNLESKLILVGQAKGKFGGGSRRPFRHTQKKVREGARLKFSYLIVVGNRDGYVGLGFGKSRSSAPARQDALRLAKLNIMKVLRGCGSWDCHCNEPHSIPFEVIGKCGSVRIKLMPAPKGVGLVISDEGKKIMELAGIKDIWVKSTGQRRTRLNYIYAIMDGFSRINAMKFSKEQIERRLIV
jgi:small subunit ribosomal protein S5